MIYLDFSRKAGEWVPNEFGGRENIDAIVFLRKLNEEIGRSFPDAVTIAEESTSWPMVSRPTYIGGLGFSMKWDMGWMNDTLDYMELDPIHRKFHHGKLTFRRMYAYSENFVLPLSHDEVVHLKKSLISKMPGNDAWKMAANLRLLLAYMWALPGKKLLFMGGEFGQWKEWNHDTSLDWHLLDDPRHAGLRLWVRDLNRLLAAEPALHELDFDPRGFEWIDCNDADHSIVSLERRGQDARANGSSRSSTSRRCRATGISSASTAARTGRRSPTATRRSTAEAASATWAAPSRSAVPVHGRSHSLALSLPPLGRPLPEADPGAGSRAGSGRVDRGRGRTTAESEDEPSWSSRRRSHGPLRLHPRPLLPAAAREPLARGDRGAGLRVPVPRLERADHGRVLRGQRARPDPRRGEPHRRDRQQLRVDELQLRADAALVARGEAARRLRRDPRGRPHERRALLGARLGDRAAVQPHDPAARRRRATRRRRSSGASATSSAASAGRPRGCGCPRPRSTCRRSKRSPRPGSASRSSRRTRPATSARGGGDWAAESRPRASIRRGRTASRCRPAARSRSSSTTARSRAPSPSIRSCCPAATTSPSGSSGAFDDARGRPSSSTSPRTARPTATITATATWRWRTRSARSRGRARRA